MAKVYVSSTIADLEEERRAVLEWLRATRHQAVDSYLPDSESVRESCLDDIDRCDLYVLILGHRYGFQPRAENLEALSITHLEFRRAGLSQIPRIALLRTSVPDIRLSDIEDPERNRLVTAFRAEVQEQVRTAEFSNLQGLILSLSAGVENELEKLRTTSSRAPAGWVSRHLQNVGLLFSHHMAASALRPAASTPHLYLDLLMQQRTWGASTETPADKEDIADSGRSLEELIATADSPLLLLGEGGAGKTTSLLYAIARAADRAQSHPEAPIPIYANLAKLTALADVADLHRLIADSVPLARDWDDVVDGARAEERPLLFFFDSFNELPEHLHRTSAVALKRFIEKHQKNDLTVVASRVVSQIEQLGRPPSEFASFDILRLAPDKVQAFLDRLGLGTLYERLPAELRDLAGNPFMLSAIAATLAGKAHDTLPRNRGKLYESFVAEWMLREEKKQRGLDYSYQRVKQPLLTYLAARMTAAGETSLTRTTDIDEEIEAWLEDVHLRIRRRGGMPEDWTVDGCLDEILGDGLLKRLGDRLYFMHQSVQEYFTGLHFRTTAPSVLAEFMPKLSWKSVETYGLAEPPNHRFVPALLMEAGLLDDGTAIVEALAGNPVLAAAAVSSSNRVDPSLLATLERRWLELLDHDDLHRRIVGCSCLTLAPMRSLAVVRRLVSFATDAEFANSYVGVQALARLGAQEAIAVELAALLIGLTDEQFADRHFSIGSALSQLEPAKAISPLFDAWRSAAPKSSVQRRFEALLKALPDAIVIQTLEAIRDDRSNAERAADAQRILAARDSWNSTPEFSAQILEEDASEHERARRTADAYEAMRHATDEELTAALQSLDIATRSAAAAAAAARHAPVGEAILEAVLQIGIARGHEHLIDALIALWGEATVVARLGGATQERARRVGTLTPNIGDRLEAGHLPASARTELERLVPGFDAYAVQRSDDPAITWILRHKRWPDFWPVYELRADTKGLQLYRRDMGAVALQILSGIPGDAASAELRRLVRHSNADLQPKALSALAMRREPGLARELLQYLKDAASADFAAAALGALATMQSVEAVALIDELPLLALGDADSQRVSERREVHPTWGRSDASGWAWRIHQTLVGSEVDTEVQAKLDAMLSSSDPNRRRAAVEELSRWSSHLDAERRSRWLTKRRTSAVIRHALSDPSEDVRIAAALGLAAMQSGEATKALADALSNDVPEVRVAAAEALAQMTEEKNPRAVAEMRSIVDGTHPIDLRRRAGKALLNMPGGADPYHDPIQSAIVREAAEEALPLIAQALEVFPEDVELFWWRGHAYRMLGRGTDAAADFQRAAELMKDEAIIPQALAETFLELQDYPRAMEAARRCIEIAPDDADMQSTLAWSCYKGGAIEDSVLVARKAVELDPIDPCAIWVLVLGHLRQGDVSAGSVSFEHALQVWRVFSPGFDDYFLPVFREELEAVDSEDPDHRHLIAEIIQALDSPAVAGGPQDGSAA